MSTSIYYLDANVFIESAKRYYAFDLAPGFWKSLENHAQKKHILTVDRIISEIKKGNDELSTWVPKHFDPTKISTDEPQIIESFGKMMSWVNSQSQFFDAAKAEFASVADGWLLAAAKANGAIVVTHEVFNKDKKNKVPMPNVCQAFDVHYISVFELMRSLKISI